MKQVSRTSIMASVLLGPVVPMAAAVQVPELPTELTPGWVSAFLLGLWLAHAILDRAGKLPWAAPAPAQSLTVVEVNNLREIMADPSKVDQIHQIVTREDSTRPGFYLVWSSAKERQDFENKLDDHMRLMHATIDTMDAMKRSLSSAHNKLDSLIEKRGAG